MHEESSFTCHALFVLIVSKHFFIFPMEYAFKIINIISSQSVNMNQCFFIIINRYVSRLTKSKWFIYFYAVSLQEHVHRMNKISTSWGLFPTPSPTLIVLLQKIIYFFFFFLEIKIFFLYFMMINWYFI